MGLISPSFAIEVKRKERLILLRRDSGRKKKGRPLFHAALHILNFPRAKRGKKKGGKITSPWIRVSEKGKKREEKEEATPFTTQSSNRRRGRGGRGCNFGDSQQRVERGEKKRKKRNWLAATIL